MITKYGLFILLFFIYFKSISQVCTTNGQTPQTAFPVCGTDTFHQASVPLCGQTDVTVGCSDGAAYQNKNPYWYKFTCFSAGTLGFQINPNTPSDDYDWQLWDVTGLTDLNVIFGSTNLMIANNWSSIPGSTGTSNLSASLTACAGPTYPNQSKMPTLIQGHNYLLLVSHFTNTQDGYSLSFGNGTASITDTTPPRIQDVSAFCDGQHIFVVLNKHMKCSSLAADGSDFILSPAIANIISATGSGCTNGFNMDTLTLTLDKPLSPGTYNVAARIGTDGNTLLDNCGNSIPVGNSLPVKIVPFIPAVPDSITPTLLCGPDKVFIFFDKPIKCNSIAADGSDFTVTGPQSVTVTKAIAIVCTTNNIGDNVATGIEVDVQPIFTGGTYTITLVRGSDGNTVIDQCGLESLPGAQLTFNVKQSVSAAFTYTINWGCTSDTLSFAHTGNYGVNQWTWNLDDNNTSTQQNPSKIYTVFGIKKVSLKVSNGVCADSSTQNINLNNQDLKAAFIAPDYVCPEDLATFKDTSIGTVVSWKWSFGNGDNSQLQTPVPERYTPPVNLALQTYTVTLIVGSNANCFDTATKVIQVPKSCYIAVPTAFTPNDDGLNDYLYPLNAYKAENLEFNVYNRYGQLIYHTTDWTKKWNGYVNGILQPAGTYVWMLNYTEKDTGKKIAQKGTTVLIR